MAQSLEECRSMVDAADRAGVHLVVGHSHSFDRPILRTRELIASGAYGAPKMIAAQYYTDFLYRLRRPAELDPEKGGGVILNQGAHQVDIVRLLAGARATSVRALAGRWDATRPVDGAYAALLNFEGGVFASLLYQGYGHFDGDELCGDVTELGEPRDRSRQGAARRRLAGLADANEEVAAKAARNYGGAAQASYASENRSHQHFGLVVVSCERADLRPLPNGIMVYAADEAKLDPLPPPRIPRVEVIDELWAAVSGGTPALHDGRWGMATLEVCLAMLDSARENRDIALHHQIAAPAVRCS
jgi:phthalate 4,5-cis-dihydrodiol dehydrogenase